MYAVRDVISNDTTPNKQYTNLLLNDLQNRYNIYSQEQVLFLQKYLNNYTDALNTITTLRNLTANLSTYQAENINNWLDIEQLQINIALADSAYKDSIIINNADMLMPLAQNNSQKGQIKAQLLLESVGLAQFDEYTPLPEEQMSNKSAFAETKNNVEIGKSQDLLYIYPNPVNNKLTVEYALLVSTSINKLGIYDIKGTLIKTVPIKEQLGLEKIDVSNLTNGTYIISFGTNGIGKYSKKFIVKH